MTGSGSAIFGIFETRLSWNAHRMRFGRNERTFAISFVSRTQYRAAWLRALKPHTKGNHMAAPKPVRAMNPDRIKIFTGSANPALAEAMCRILASSWAR